jgi:hypothetical protein
MTKDDVTKALRQAYNLGQIYWQQADSEYMSQHKKADQTEAKFQELLETTSAALEAKDEPVVNTDHVICPNCVHQFRAIPQNVQKLMLASGFEPPFTTPPQRTWVGLTDEDYKVLREGVVKQGKPIAWMIEQIEAKLKEKNCADH